MGLTKHVRDFKCVNISRKIKKKNARRKKHCQNVPTQQSYQPDILLLCANVIKKSNMLLSQFKRQSGVHHQFILFRGCGV